MNDAPPPQPLRSTHQLIRVLLAILLAAAFTGYFVGLRQSRQASQRETVYGKDPVPGAAARAAPTVVGYAQQPARAMGVNKDWGSNLATLRQPAASAPPRERATAQALAQLLEERESRRAFDGAPPIIPHPTPPLGVAACLACHEKATMVGDKRAATMSHPLYANCTQCHIEVTSPDNKELWQNTFAGLRPAGAKVAFAGAPPAMPHPAWMRNDCQSCHGVHGPSALRTTHPERQSCLQCHALASPHDLLPTVVGEAYIQKQLPSATPTKEKR